MNVYFVDAALSVLGNSPTQLAKTQNICQVFFLFFAALTPISMVEPATVRQ